MDDYIATFQNLHIDKLSVSFTWDDNFHRHKEFIAPLFSKYNKKRTFYINVGDKDFTSQLISNYKQLSNDGFEIGSHGYNHKSMKMMTEKEFVDQMESSIREISMLLNFRPITFAFPHHEYNSLNVELTKHYFIETRNTLNQSHRISLKSHTKLSDVIQKIDQLICSNKNIVFSGHSVKTALDKSTHYEDGYEPIQLNLINDILLYLEGIKRIEVITFEQAAFKEYLKQNCNYTQTECILSPYNLTYLTQYGINLDRINSIL